MGFAISAVGAAPDVPKAFQQQNEADLVIGFWHWDSIAVEKPASKGKMTRVLSRREFVDFLSKEKIGRSMVVVILDKRDAPKGKEYSEDALIADLHQMGFRRVVLQQAVSVLVPDGLPILRESIHEQANQALDRTAPSVTPPAAQEPRH